MRTKMAYARLTGWVGNIPHHCEVHGISASICLPLLLSMFSARETSALQALNGPFRRSHSVILLIDNL
eukprot:gene8742-6148_t